MKYLFIGLLFMGLFACKSTKNIAPDTFEGNQIRFGSGGGITGAVTQWALLENGGLWGVSGHPEASLQYVARVSKKEVKAVFAAIDTLNWGEAPDEPGNMYRFLELREPDQRMRMVWDPFKQENFPELNAFFDKLKVIMQDY
ncbi:MAG: hypothetical protein R3B47_21420, partial [Bacteroidia bacterium]